MIAEQADTIAEIQESVLGYLAEHPGAADSVDGIRNWWLFQRMARASMECVQRALDDLEANGSIERAILHDGNVLYRRTGRNKGDT